MLARQNITGTILVPLAQSILTASQEQISRLSVSASIHEQKFRNDEEGPQLSLDYVV